ncbi:MAG: tRNA (adenosine(37)-N6)-dimethylallyltransferase MiaA [Bacteroidales bacterium]|nr:tRNA (adenosine(37)-N6)-dimethylallyltransferase MiaA [Bacteroidales bacterium]MCM1147598.1 tRNA (adenosine(37)-N6)-dimethylallyltransferase MiaA [Bacteroidales bacterium]MCM1206388.1 tRNA (adenosine(37)-N6)-dimethylallyltransferase MiaA [Bacillota bacterium]MCM1509122.1 tRNA (adenosine(37)-N6)-dimethylallyltransferase MiaA [Clostridium sp.]
MITIIGPTASGKTALAAHLAASYIIDGQSAEIISGDSRQVYRYMDIGTGKDLCDYSVRLSEDKKYDESAVPQIPDIINVPYHLIDICNPGEKYNIFQYQQDFLQAYSDCRQRDVLPILCGGSGLYVESVIREYNLSPVPKNEVLREQMAKKSMEELTAILMDLKERNNSDMHNKTDVDSPQRAIRAIEIETYNLERKTEDRFFPPIDTVVVGVDIPRDERRRKISSRLKARVDEGMVDEIKGILDSGVSPDDLIYYGLEYKYVTEYVIGRRSYEDMLEQLEIHIHQFAKRQMTWFRGMERRGIKINWVSALLPMEEKVTQIRKIYESASRKDKRNE